MDIVKNNIRKIKCFVSILLTVIIIFNGSNINCIIRNVNADTDNTETQVLYFIDNTAEKWISNDNAVIQLVDNTNGHISYYMNKTDDYVWSVKVPKSSINITFNRLDSDKKTQWNSWSAGGRDNNNTYYADGAEYGHWDIWNSEAEENYFHAGDIVYLDLTEFKVWENDNALMYVNFTDASKEQNNDKNIEINNTDISLYNPIITDYKENDYIYAYIVTKSDEGVDKLRFWRGNAKNLWNSSIILDYEHYKSGYNCVNVNGWDKSGYLSKKEYEINDIADKDNDNVSDYLEALLGLDKTKSDTDGDGISDYDEVVITKTDPLKYDSVKEGISDADIDSDNDGLTNIEEISYSTNPLMVDSDEDGLNDYDEIKIYLTDATLEDSDGDGLNDGDEIILGFNPNLPDTDGNGIIDSEEYVEQVVDTKQFDENLYTDNIAEPTVLSVCAKGNVNRNISVTEYNGYLKGEEREYVGKAVEISDSNMKSGKLEFKLDDLYSVNSYNIGDTTTNGLVICYNDGSNTEPLDTVYNNDSKTLTADISKDGIYFILNVIEWLDSMGIEYNEVPDINNESEMVNYSGVTNYKEIEDYNTMKNYNEIANYSAAINYSTTKNTDIEIKPQTDIVFIIDTTGSMGNAINNVKGNIINFVSAIESAGIKPNFALVEYKDITSDGKYSTKIKKNSNNSNWFKDANEFKAEISRLNATGGGDYPETVIDALEMARQLDLRSSSQKFFIVVTDAEYKIDNNYGISSMSEMIEYLVNDNINVSVVSDLRNKAVYQHLYEETGGIYANIYGDFRVQLLSIASKIKEETSDGYWIALNGLIPQVVKLNEKPVVNGTCDTDGDKLEDWHELNDLKKTISFDITPFLKKLGFPIEVFDKTIPIYGYTSNPVKADSDDDGLLDGEAIRNRKGEIITPVDSQPLVQNGTKEIWESHILNVNNKIIPNDYYSKKSDTELSDYIPDYAKDALSAVEKKLADELVKILLKLREPVNSHSKELRNAALFIKNIADGNAEFGAYVLRFVYDNQRMAYHSQPDTWQRNFGYNEFYDEIFRIGSYMKPGILKTNIADKEYALWMWKGDYWNLQSGAEIGLYKYKGKYSGTEQYDAIDYEVPMELYLYNYYDKGNIENVFSWKPIVNQWWITGFNVKYTEPDPDKMVTIGKIDLSEHNDLYYSFAKSTKYQDIEKENLVFDSINKCIYVIWYNEEYVK